MSVFTAYINVYGIMSQWWIQCIAYIGLIQICSMELVQQQPKKNIQLEYSHCLPVGFAVRSVPIMKLWALEDGYNLWLQSGEGSKVKKQQTFNTSYSLFHICNIKCQFFFAFFPLEDFLQYFASKSEMSELKSFSLDFCLCYREK